MQKKTAIDRRKFMENIELATENVTLLVLLLLLFYCEFSSSYLITQIVDGNLHAARNETIFIPTIKPYDIWFVIIH